MYRERIFQSPFHQKPFSRNLHWNVNEKEWTSINNQIAESIKLKWIFKKKKKKGVGALKYYITLKHVPPSFVIIFIGGHGRVPKLLHHSTCSLIVNSNSTSNLVRERYNKMTINKNIQTICISPSPGKWPHATSYTLQKHMQDLLPLLFCSGSLY